MMMLENAYLIQNKRTSLCLKIITLFLISMSLFIVFFEYPKTIYFQGLVIESEGDNYIEVLSQETSFFTNVYMKLIIKDKKYNYKIKNIEPLNINITLYNKVLLTTDCILITNEIIDFNIYLGKTTVFKELIKNIKKGILYGQT